MVYTPAPALSPSPAAAGTAGERAAAAEVPVGAMGAPRRAPPPAGALLEVTGETRGSKVFIIYENGRAYPEYLVTYYR